MSKTFISNENLESSAWGMASALGISRAATQKTIDKMARTRIIGDDEKVFCVTDKSRYVQSKVPAGLLSAADISALVGLGLDSTKKYLSAPYGFHDSRTNAIYSCILKTNWKFSED